MKVIGTVKSIIFKNLETGYAVIELETGSKSIVCTGKFPVLGEAEILEVEGDYKVNAKYGEQLAVTSVQIKKPTSSEAIQKYLSCGLISGVGEVTARNIVQMYGEKTLEIIDKQPILLEKIKGISKRKALEIGNAYREIKKMQDAVIFLQNYDITIGLSVKIYEAYKHKTIEIMQTNPYKLIEDIDGVGFKTADKIANKLGISETSGFRIRAGIMYVLSELAEKQGSTVVLLSDLINGACSILGFGEDMRGEVERVVTSLLIEGLIRKIDYYGEEGISTTKNYTMEKKVASKLLMLIASSPNYNLNIDSLISAYQASNNIQLHPTQKKAIECAVNNGVAVITGGPGTGKTTIIKGLLYIFDSLNKKTMLMAPTGRASKRLEQQTGQSASTIHRALEMGMGTGKYAFGKNENNPLDADVIIIDEVSMLDVYLAYSLLNAIKLGSKIIFVGDKDQLPSVGAGNVLADILASDIVPYVMLNQIFRQGENSQITVNAHKINNGQMPDLSKKSDDFFYSPKFDPQSVLSDIVEMVASRIPNFKGVKPSDIQVIAPMKSGIAGVDNINLKLQERLNPKQNKPELVVGKKIFRLFDKVMQTSNNYDLEWTRLENGLLVTGQGVFNGDIGYIDEINNISNTMYVTFDDGRRVGYSLVELEDLTLAYAITVHKSQGSEFPVVILPILAGNPKLYNKNLLYTAVTRAKQMVVLIGKSSNIYYMINNKYSETRKTLLKQFLQTDITNF